MHARRQGVPGVRCADRRQDTGAPCCLWGSSAATLLQLQPQAAWSPAHHAWQPENRCALPVLGIAPARTPHPRCVLLACAALLAAVCGHVHRLQLHLRPRIHISHGGQWNRGGRPLEQTAVRRGSRGLDTGMLGSTNFSRSKPHSCRCTVGGTSTPGGRGEGSNMSPPPLPPTADLPGHQRVPVHLPAGPQVHVPTLRLQQHPRRIRVSRRCCSRRATQAPAHPSQLPVPKLACAPSHL